MVAIIKRTDVKKHSLLKLHDGVQVASVPSESETRITEGKLETNFRRSALSDKHSGVWQQDRQCTYKATLRRVLVTVVAVEKQKY
jgi:hypothetical protein